MKEATKNPKTFNSYNKKILIPERELILIMKD